MHILQLLPSLDVGGVERGVLDLTKGLLARGHRVSVVSSGGALVEPLTSLGATHHTLPIHHKSPWTIWDQVPELCRLIRETHVDVVHARSRAPAWVGYLAARRAGTPFVTTCHGFYKPHVASTVMTWGRTVIVPSQALGRYVLDHFHVPPERLRIIPRGVDLAQFLFREPQLHRDGEPWRIGLVGRITTLKGHQVAIQALHQLLRHHPQAKLVIIGDAPSEKAYLRDQLEDLAVKLGVAHAIEWAGARRDIPDCLASLDIALAPSVYPESFGRSVIEAQAVGVPVVASRLGALGEVIEDGATGLLVTPGDPGELAAAIGRLLEDEPLRHRLARQARQRVEDAFHLDQMVEKTLEVYRDCLERPRIVIWKLSALGDLVLATPSLRAIRRQFPQSPITLIVGRPLYEIVARCPYVNEVLVYDPTRKDRAWRNRWRWIRRLKRAGFDLSIDLQNSRFTHVAAWLATIPTRIGYARRWGRLLTRGVVPPKAPMPPVAHQHYLLQQAGIAPDGEQLELWPSADDERRIKQWLSEAGLNGTAPLVGLHVGGSARWKTKRWEADHWAALCDQLTSRGLQVVLTGSVSDGPFVEEVLAHTSSKPHPPSPKASPSSERGGFGEVPPQPTVPSNTSGVRGGLHVAVGRTRLMELACLIRRCAAFVTTDSAPLHIAAAMGTPTVALFGPTDPTRHAPPAASLTVLRKPVFCSPCYSPRCRTITHACMKRISADEVLQAIQAFLSKDESLKAK